MDFIFAEGTVACLRAVFLPEKTHVAFYALQMGVFEASK